LVVLGFDGARRRDATALVAMDVDRSHMWPLGVWQRPDFAEDDWEVPALEVDELVEMAFNRWDVWRLYGDPPYWDDRLDTWAGKYGEKRVIKWWTNRQRPTGNMVRNFKLGMDEKLFTHDGDPLMAEHVMNAFRQDTNLRTEEDEPVWLIRKERPNSPLKIDAAMASALAYEAYGDCVAAGKPRSRRNRALVTF
jgi:hypothetical protein